MSPLIAAIIGPVFDLIGRVVPDKQKQAEMQLEVLKMQQNGEFKQIEVDLQLALGQMGTNTEEAKHPSIFVAGWRPFIGWVCGAGFTIQFVLGPIASWGSALAGHPVQFPKLDLMEMLPILGGMLGLGAYRTYEKTKKVA